MNKTIALLGNPNSGKTTLFNKLTGTYQKTGNWSGVTTEKKEGFYKKDKELKIVDLPGVYSLEAKSDDEIAVLNFLKSTPPDVIINVVDGTNLERNLYLTLELASLKIPTVIAVNMYDDLMKNGININIKKFSDTFGVEIVPISALKSINVSELMTYATKTNKTLKTPITALNGDINAVELRYKFIEEQLREVVSLKEIKGKIITKKIDKILMHKVFGIPIFFCAITLIYFLSIKIGGVLGGQISLATQNFSGKVFEFLYSHQVPDWIISLTCDAIINGIGAVGAFLPQVLILFALLTIVEESGYSARIAFLLDNFFRAFGLSGKSFIPLMVSCGCTVSGIMSSRTIDSASEKRMTIFLAPFMPCSAKMAVFGWFATKFFDGSALIATSLYFISILSVAIFGFILKKFKAFKQEGGVFILEIPTLRLPSIKDVACVLWEKVKDFTIKVAMIVFVVSVILWALKNIGASGYVFGDVEQSFLYTIGNNIKFIFYPLGFGNWQASVSVLSGIMAKEAVVETLALLSSDATSLFYNSFSAYAFLAFILLSPPCVASIAIARRELKSKKWLFFMVLFQFVSAYLVAFLINLLGIILEYNFGLILSVFIVIIILVVSGIFIWKLKKRKCSLCTKCKKGEGRCPTQSQCMTE